MPIKDVLLPLVGEPTKDAIAAIDKCVEIAGDFGAKISALAIEEDIHVRPKVIVSSGNAAVSEVVRSVTDAQGLLDASDSAAASEAWCGPRKDSKNSSPALDVADLRFGAFAGQTH